MIESSEQDLSNPIPNLAISRICKETLLQFWIDESATYSCNFTMMGILACGVFFLAGWLPV